MSVAHEHQTAPTAEAASMAMIVSGMLGM